MQKRVVLPIIAGLVLLAASPAFATVVIDFEQATGVGGTVTLSGGNASTTDVPIDEMKVAGTGATDGIYDLSGTCSGVGQDANGSACLAFNTAAGTISITGGVPGLPSLPNGTLLLSGTFGSSSVTLPVSSLLVVSGSGPDAKNDQLLLDLGIPGFQFNFFAFSIDAQISGSTFTGASTDIANSGVPEPASAALLGGELLFVAGVLRRRTKRA